MVIKVEDTETEKEYLSSSFCEAFIYHLRNMYVWKYKCILNTTNSWMLFMKTFLTKNYPEDKCGEN